MKNKIKRIVILVLVAIVIVGVIYETQQCAMNNELRRMYDILEVYGWRWSVDNEEWYIFATKEGKTPILRLQEDTLYDLYRRDISTFIEVVSDF